MAPYHQLPRLKSWFKKLRSRTRRPLPAAKPQPQLQSHLLGALPLEIRLQIYTYVIESYGTVQHIHLSDGKLTHMCCTSPAEHTFFQVYSYASGICPESDPTYRRSAKNGWELIPLLLSCRQIYLECIEIIYSSIIFRIAIQLTAERFIAVVPAQFIALTHLYLSHHLESPMYSKQSREAWPDDYPLPKPDPRTDEMQWEGFWLAFARLHVRVLIVEFLDTVIRVPEHLLLEPLNQVSAGRFEVVVRWPAGVEASNYLTDAKFVIRRPPEPMERIRIQFDRATCGYRVRWPQEANKTWRRLKRISVQ